MRKPFAQLVFFLIAVFGFFFVLTQFQWTVRIEHASLIHAGQCKPVHGARQFEAHCMYPDVTVEGSILKQGYTIIDEMAFTDLLKSNTFTLKQDGSVAISYDTSNSIWTWRSFLLALIALGFLSMPLFGLTKRKPNVPA